MICVLVFFVFNPSFGLTESVDLFGQTNSADLILNDIWITPEEPKEGVLLLKPDNLTFEEAAAIPFGGLEALHFLKKANMQQGQKILINGAGGSIGTAAIQLAKYFSAEVTSVDRSEKLEMLRSIGSDHVIDYQKEDFTKNDKKYDVIFDVIGKSSYSRSIKSLEEGGIYLLANPGLSQMIRGLLTSKISKKKVFSGTSGSGLQASDYRKAKKS